MIAGTWRSRWSMGTRSPRCASVLCQQGYLVYWSSRGTLLGGQFQLSGRKVKQDQFVIFNQQFLTLIKAGYRF